MVNLDTKDFGLYQINLKSALNRNNMKDTTWNRNVLASKLVSDFNFATKNAIDELAYWQKFHKNNWSKIWEVIMLDLNLIVKKLEPTQKKLLQL